MLRSYSIDLNLWRGVFYHVRDMKFVAIFFGINIANHSCHWCLVNGKQQHWPEKDTDFYENNEMRRAHENLLKYSSANKYGWYTYSISYNANTFFVVAKITTSSSCIFTGARVFISLSGYLFRYVICLHVNLVACIIMMVPILII